VRFIIYGAGGIGGTIGARLHMAGLPVVLIARGAHYECIAKNGLRFVAPDGSYQLVLLCMKSQHTEPALRDLRAVASDETAVVCAQNGVANERAALRYFTNVYAMVVILPAVHLEPGVVVTHAQGVGGILDVGRYPRGSDDVSATIAAALERAGFSAHSDSAVMRQKHAKLLMNLNNALQAAVGLNVDARDVGRRLRDEALAVYAAAGIDCATAEEVKARRASGPRLAAVEGASRGGGSSWQSLVRGTGDIEADYLNGEIALLGRLHGIATPANAALQRIANELAARRAQPGALTLDEVRAACGSGLGHGRNLGVTE